MNSARAVPPDDQFWRGTQAQADRLRELGFEVFPCNKQKKPKVKSWIDSNENNAATFNDDDLIGLRLPPNTALLDVDRPEQYAEQRLETPETLTIPTRREGGLHHLFRTDGRPVAQITDDDRTIGFDTRVGGKGYIIAWHPEQITAVSEWAMAPEWMYELKNERSNGTEPRVTDEDAPEFATRHDILSYVGTRAKQITDTRAEWLMHLMTMRKEGRIYDLIPDKPWTDDDLEHFADEAMKWTEKPFFTVAETPDETLALFGPLRPLDTPYCEVGFPRSVLPAWMDTFAMEITEALQTPAGAVEMAMLGALSMSAQGRIEVVPGEGWRELGILWDAIAMLSGERKSTISEYVYGPIYRWEHAFNTRHQETYSRSKARKDYLEDQLKLARRQHALVNLTTEERAAAFADSIDAQTELDRFIQIFPLSIIADDATPEALAVKMDQNHQNMSINSTEGGVFDNFTGRYNDKVNTDLALKAYTGDPGKQDRITREPISFTRPTLTFAVTVQPTVLVDIGKNERLRGNGFLARFLYAVPFPRYGSRHIRTKAVSEPTKARYEEGMKSILDAITPFREEGTWATFTFSAEATDRIYEFAGAIEPRLAPGEDLSDLGPWGGKLVGQIVRIAGLLHLADTSRRPDDKAVSVETLNRALGLADYLIAHAKVAFQMMNGHGAPPQAQRLLDHMNKYRDESDGQFLYGDLKHRTKMDDTELGSAIVTLIEHGLIRALAANEIEQKRGPKPKGVYVLRPQ